MYFFMIISPPLDQDRFSQADGEIFSGYYQFEYLSRSDRIYRYSQAFEKIRSYKTYCIGN